MIKNPITDHLPSNSYKITFSFDSTPVKLSSYLNKIPKEQNIVVFIGAMAHGEDNFADHLVDDKIAISQYSLSASVACGKVGTLLFFLFFFYLLKKAFKSKCWGIHTD